LSIIKKMQEIKIIEFKAARKQVSELFILLTIARAVFYSGI